MHTCGNKRRPDSSTNAQNCSESPCSNPVQTWGWTFLITSQKPEKKNEEDRHFLSLVMTKNDTKRASHTFFPNCLSFKTSDKNESRRHSIECHQKRYIPKESPKLKIYYVGSFICTKLIKWPICLQSTESHLS